MPARGFCVRSKSRCSRASAACLPWATRTSSPTDTTIVNIKTAWIHRVRLVPLMSLQRAKIHGAATLTFLSTLPLKNKDAVPRGARRNTDEFCYDIDEWHRLGANRGHAVASRSYARLSGPLRSGRSKSETNLARSSS